MLPLIAGAVAVFVVSSCAVDKGVRAERAFVTTFGSPIPSSVSGLQGIVLCAQDCVSWLRFSADPGFLDTLPNTQAIPCTQGESEFTTVLGDVPSGVFSPPWEPRFTADATCFEVNRETSGSRRWRVLALRSPDGTTHHVVAGTLPK